MNNEVHNGLTEESRHDNQQQNENEKNFLVEEIDIEEMAIDGICGVY